MTKSYLVNTLQRSFPRGKMQNINGSLWNRVNHVHAPVDSERVSDGSRLVVATYNAAQTKNYPWLLPELLMLQGHDKKENEETRDSTDTESQFYCSSSAEILEQANTHRTD